MRATGRSLSVLTSLGLILASAVAGVPAQAYPHPGQTAPAAAYLSDTHASGVVGQRERRAEALQNRTTSAVTRYHGRAGTFSPMAAPAAVTLDTSTETLYVSNLDDGSIRVVDARSCNARRQHCRAPLASFGAGPGNTDLFVDSSTKTLYASYGGDEDGKVDVFDVRRCSARDTSGCAGPVASMTLPGPGGFSQDRRTRTLFVGSFGTSVWLVDASTCNARRTQGCAAPVATITTAESGPVIPLVDDRTRTLYVPSGGDEPASTVSVVDLRTCVVGSTTGCGRAPVTTRVGDYASIATIDPASQTLYVASGDGHVSVIDQRTCNARNTSGCSGERAPSVRTGPSAQFMGLSRTSPTLYVLTFSSDTIDVIDTRHCRARDTSGCAATPRSIQTASGEPWWMLMDSRTDTLYVTPLTTQALQVIDARTCSVRRTEGCRKEAPSTPGAGGNAIDPGRHTYYQTSNTETSGFLRFVDTSRCTAARPSGCEGTSSVPLGKNLGSMAIDLTTSTLYVRDFTLSALLVIDTTRCNVSRHDRCAPIATIPIPSIGIPEVNSVTHTVYVTQGKLGVAVIPGARCRTGDISACNDPLFTVAAGEFTDIAWPDVTTNTIYVGNAGAGTFTLLDGAACDQRSSGCRAVATTSVEAGPVSLAFDPATHSAFAAVFSGGEERGRVAVIDTRVCRAGNTSGCGHTWPTTPTARGTLGATFVPQTRTLVTSNIFSATISLVDTRHCNATDASQCGRRSTEIAVGRFPVVSWADPAHDTLYVSNQWEQSTSLIGLRHPCRSRLCFHA